MPDAEARPGKAGRPLSPAFLIRGATEEDAEMLGRLSVTLGYGTEQEAVPGRLRAILASDSNLVVVAADPTGRVVGWLQAQAVCRLQTGPKVEITGLLVDPEVRRHGVGRRLVAEAERWARGRSVDGMVVRSNVARVDSHRFYPALGFDLSKRQAVYQKDLRGRA